MKYYFKTLRVCFQIAFIALLSGCVLVSQAEQSEQKMNEKVNIQVESSQYKQSEFKQVEATFFTKQSKELVFRVLSNIEQTSQWLARVDSLEVIEVYNNHQYLLRTRLNSPWPFHNRELITCVDTFFEEAITRINISSCSERVPEDEAYVRLPEVESFWTIKKISDSFVEVNYKTWLDPTGHVPAFIFNRELINSTETDLGKLKVLIDNSSLADFSY